MPVPLLFMTKKNLGGARYARGKRAMRKILGPLGDRVLEQLEDVAPQFGQFIVEFAYGDIYARRGLDPRSREVAAVAALTAMGGPVGPLKTHINGALNVGCTKLEIVEVIMQMAAYAGFPRALEAMLAAKDVFNSRNRGRRRNAKTLHR